MWAQNVGKKMWPIKKIFFYKFTIFKCWILMSSSSLCRWNCDRYFLRHIDCSKMVIFKLEKVLLFNDIFVWIISLFLFLLGSYQQVSNLSVNVCYESQLMQTIYPIPSRCNKKNSFQNWCLPGSLKIDQTIQWLKTTKIEILDFFF